ncbi:MAG: hypothetical protein ACN4GF_09680 [Lentimonas sp.]
MPADFTFLSGPLRKLNQSQPPELQVDLDLGNNRLHKLVSDADLREEYAQLFRSIKLDNLERAVNFINEKHEVDAKTLVKTVEQLKGEEAQRVKVTLDWLNQMAEHLRQYLDLANELDKAQLVFAGGARSIELDD